MNAKHLFLTLSMLLASFTFAWGYEVQDQISFANVSAHGSYSTGYQTITNANYFGSSAEYSGSLYYHSDGYLALRSGRNFGSVVSGGVVKSVEVFWNGATIDGTSLLVMASNDNLDLEDISYDFEAELEYSAGDASAILNNFGGVEYKTIIFTGTSSNKMCFSKIVVTWEVASTNSITIDSHISNGSVTSSASSAAAGDVVTLRFTPDADYSLTAYSIGDMNFDLACAGYWDDMQGTYVAKFIMPDASVTVTASFAEIVRVSNAITLESSTVTVESGKDVVFTFTTKYNHDKATPVYDGVISFDIADRSIVNVSDSTFNAVSGGSCTLHGLAKGSTTLYVKSSKTATISERKSAKVTITVIPREVVLLAERSDSYYVMENTLAGHTAPAHEVVYNATDSKYYYDDAVSLSDVTWNATTLEEGAYAMQNPYSNEYLKYDKGNITMSVSSYTWWKNGDDKLITSDGKENGIATNGTSFLASADLTNAAIEALVGTNFIPFGSYSTVSGAAINDPRTLTEGNYGTFCSPYDVPSVVGVGAKFFTLEGKVVDGANLAGIVISDPVDKLVAGHAYLYQVDEGSDAINLERCMRHLTKASTSTEDGFVGCLADDGDAAGKVYATSGVTPRSDGDYILKDNKLHYVPTGATGSARTYRAFIRAKELNEVKAGSVPKRRIVIVDGFTGEIGSEDSETSVDELVDSSELNWDKPVYNIMGVRVSKGATGVLIQNGHKFFVK